MPEERDEREGRPDVNPLPGATEGGDRIVGTAIGSSDAGSGVGGGDVGRASAPGDTVGGTGESRATVGGDVDEGAAADVDARGFARATRKSGSEAGLAGGEGDLGGGGDVAGDRGGLDEEGDEGKPV